MFRRPTFPAGICSQGDYLFIVSLVFSLSRHYTRPYSLSLSLSLSLQGGRLVRAPSMTLSESQAMEDFDFLGSDENVLLARFSKASFADIPEGKRHNNIMCTICQCVPKAKSVADMSLEIKYCE